ncbi:hypothetical protein SKAU_G00096890 [Synaphobranchus kaupii]|uniref:HTH CENPB-type domain-containing protein n=1 Tax=Synaphobranchus kaupii TaxID=118154 RepID=A0A9Q1J708_SYNKA|nr:hypothetical protein SKAU_G00096890 [Synaphobranchus kaupii]
MQIHQVPRQTLQDRVSGRVVHGSRSGGATMLSPEDENSLVQYCLYCAPRGFPLTHRVLAAFATALRRKRHPGGNIPKLGKTWWRNFRARYIDVLSMRRPDNLDRARAACATREVVDQFYTLLDGTLEALGLKDKPSQIYNCDETGFAMERGSSTTTSIPLAAAQPSTSSTTSTTTCTCTCSLHRQPTPEEHPLVAEGLIPRDLAALLPPIQRRPVRRLPVAARVITASEYEHQYLERVEKERAGNAERQRRAALKRQREMERAAIEETIEAVIAGVGTTTSDSSNTISPSLCDSPGAPAAEAGHLPLPPPIPSAILQPPAKPSAAPPARRQRYQPPARRTHPPPSALSNNTTVPASSNASTTTPPGQINIMAITSPPVSSDTNPLSHKASPSNRRGS